MNKNSFHILVVDDDNRIRDLVKQYLEENQFFVTTAKDSDDAKKKMEIIKFDILVLDIMMPGQSGLSLTKEIKKKDAVPIILLTAKDETQVCIEGLEFGAEGDISITNIVAPTNADLTFSTSGTFPINITSLREHKDRVKDSILAL